MIDFDVVLDHLGGFGLYQILLVGMVCYYSLPSGMNSLAPVFMNYRPDHRCNVPPIDNGSLYPNLTEDDILELTTPIMTGTTDVYDTCKRYGYNLSECYGGLEECVNKSADPIPCDMGYHYDTSEFPRTVVTEFNLVCDRSILDPLATSIYMVGILIGSSIFGILADKLGRKKIMIVSCVISFAALIGCTWVSTYWLFVLCRFLVALFGFGSFLTSFVYLMEIVSSEWRTKIGVSFQIFFAIGYMILSGLAYVWRDWHKLNFATAIVGLPYAIFLFFIPESPRWLFSNGRNEEGKKITRKFARVNKVQLNEPFIWQEAEKSGEEKEKETREKSDGRTFTTVDLFRTRPIRIITLKIMFSWFVNSIVYYGLSLNAGALSGDVFINNTLNGAMEIASYIIVILLMDRIGRKWMLTSMLCLAGVGLMCTAVVGEYATNNTLETLATAFAFIAKIGISGSYAVIYNFTSELYPTVVRSNGVGLASAAARLGGILAPLVLAIQNTIPWVPNVVFCVASFLAAGLALSMPDTTKINMMESIEEAEDFYSGITPEVSVGDSNSKFSYRSGNSNEGFEKDFSSKL